MGGVVSQSEVDIGYPYHPRPQRRHMINWGQITPQRMGTPGGVLVCFYWPHFFHHHQSPPQPAPFSGKGKTTPNSPDPRSALCAVLHEGNQNDPGAVWYAHLRQGPEVLNVKSGGGVYPQRGGFTGKPTEEAAPFWELSPQKGEYNPPCQTKQGCMMLVENKSKRLEVPWASPRIGKLSHFQVARKVISKRTNMAMGPNEHPNPTTKKGLWVGWRIHLPQPLVLTSHIIACPFGRWPPSVQLGPQKPGAQHQAAPLQGHLTAISQPGPFLQPGAQEFSWLGGSKRKPWATESFRNPGWDARGRNPSKGNQDNTPTSFTFFPCPKAQALSKKQL